MSEDYLLEVRKPARYIGQEWNTVSKDPCAGQIKFALCFPDLYEIGMSNLGIRILYGILNNINDVVCERFFAPAVDMEGILRKNNLEIHSLDSRKTLKDFDIIGFSLAHELDYTNVLNILDLGKIPLKASERTDEFPLIIAGGPCTANPEPMCDFFDFFVIGEAEEIIIEIIDLYRKLKDQFNTGEINKKDLLVYFSEIEGVYVPSLYRVSYDSGGIMTEFKSIRQGVPQKIKKRFVKDFNTAYFPVGWILPYIEIVHDRITLEIMRGCPNSCRFCQARNFYYPLRQRNPQKLLDLASQAYNCSGYEEIALAGLSVSDYPFMGELLQEMLRMFQDKAVGISLPSIKPKALVGNFASLIASIKKTGLTFAPEAATEKLRKILNKDFDISIFFQAIEQAFLAGYQRVKLYFMIGLPGEEERDLDMLLEFCNSVSEARKKNSSQRNMATAWVNVSINVLIPKPHTPFQWLKMASRAIVQEKITYLRNKVKNKKIKLNFHNSEMSFLEGVFSRGDRRLGEVIELAFKKGARFDAWDDYFIFDHWLRAFKELNLDPEIYLRQRTKEEILPWDFLDTGISKDYLYTEYNKAIEIK